MGRRKARKTTAKKAATATEKEEPKKKTSKTTKKKTTAKKEEKENVEEPVTPETDQGELVKPEPPQEDQVKDEKPKKTKTTKKKSEEPAKAEEGDKPKKMEYVEKENLELKVKLDKAVKRIRRLKLAVEEWEETAEQWEICARGIAQDYAERAQLTLEDVLRQFNAPLNEE